MRTLPICLLLALTLVLPSIALAQLDPEDIPPPKPVPAEPLVEPLAVPDYAPSEVADDFSVPQPSLTIGANGEMHAFDFGVSVVPHDAGLRVSGVFVGSPAQAAGVKPNDVIVRVNENEVADGSALASQVETIAVSRKGAEQTLNVPTQAPTTQQTIPMPRAAVNEHDNVPAPQRTRVHSYSVPRTTYSAPPSYRYDPRYAPQQTYQVPRQSYSAPRSAYSTRIYRYSPGYSMQYAPRSGVSIGIGVGSPGFYGYPGYPGAGYYGRGFGYGSGYGLGPGRGRGGVGISIGGIGIRF